MKIRIFFIGIKSEGTRFSPVIATSRFFQAAKRSLKFRSVITRRPEKTNEREAGFRQFSRGGGRNYYARRKRQKPSYEWHKYSLFTQNSYNLLAL
jgi:hypothetical protein